MTRRACSAGDSPSTSLRSRLPEDEVRVGSDRAPERDGHRLAPAQTHLVHVDLVVPEVERRGDVDRAAVELERPGPGVVVPLVAVRRRDRTGERLQGGADVELPPAAVRIPQQQAACTPVAALTSVAERSSSHVTWSAESEGRTAIRSAAAAETWAAAYEVPSAWRKSGGPQIE